VSGDGHAVHKLEAAINLDDRELTDEICFT